ncbi:MAG: hypothetical protein ACRCZF_17245, partial [Gemmataceae bacterium]
MPIDFEDEDALAELLGELERLPISTEKVERYEAAVAAADAGNHTRAGFFLRLEMLGAILELPGYNEKYMPAFSWCLAQIDRDPEAFPVDDLLWSYKWVIMAMPDLLAIPVARINPLLVDIHSRYAKLGFSRRSVYMVERDVRIRLGDTKAATAAHAHYLRGRRDSMTDELDTELATDLEYFALLGQWKKTAERGQPVILGTKATKYILTTCVYTLVEPLVRLDRHEEAVAMVRRALPACLRRPRCSDVLATFTMLLAITGNSAEARKLFPKAIEELFDTGEEIEYDQMTIYPLLAVALRLFTVDQPTLRIKGPERFGLEPSATIQSCTEFAD